MTTDEKNNIDRLHLQGIGYRKIAAELGVSQNTVKSYLKRNTKPRSKEEISGVCKQCGKSIEQVPHKRKNCSAPVIAGADGGVRTRIFLIGKRR